jgi:creatinine amidohydrolase
VPLRLEELSSTQLSALPRKETVFFFPVGPLEDHGSHLPMGLHLLKSEKLALLAAERLEREKPGWKGVLMPRAPLGIDSVTTGGAITVRGHVLRDWLVDAALGLSREGFRYFVCFSGHPGPRQLTAIEEAGKIVRRRTRRLGMPFFDRGKSPILISAESALTTIDAVKRSPFWNDPTEHGGKIDTSVALWISSALVDPTFINLPRKERVAGFWPRARLRMSRKLRGYWGSPAEAQATLGEGSLKERLDDLFPKLRAVLEGANPEGLFRSWYSVLPPNRSFFKAWLMVGMLGLLMGYWVYLSFQALISG